MATRTWVARGYDDRGLFLKMALAMAATVVAGFGVQFAMGRSSFTASPPLVHAHAVIFMGWVAIYVAQSTLVARDTLVWHRRLGWIAVGWMIAMTLLGVAVTLTMVRAGRAPFFFLPAFFLVMNPMSLLFFLGLSGTAVAMRRRSDWHRRLHLCGMAVLTGPALGRLLPMPLLIPNAFWWVLAGTLIFPLVVAGNDWRRTGRVHPALLWGIAAMALMGPLIQLVTFSPAGAAAYRAVTAGAPGAAIDPYAYPPPPVMP